MDLTQKIKNLKRKIKMEEKINVAEILKSCPRGMELDCTMYDNVKFDYIASGSMVYPIKIQTPDGQIGLSKYGCYSNSKGAKCVIFPKGRTTWEGFQMPFKDGDILVSSLGSPFIFKELNGYNYSVVFTNTIKNYKKIQKLLDPLVKRYFETYCEDWWHFSDWNFDDAGENVIINYSYLDYNDEWENDSISISLDKFIEMI